MITMSSNRCNYRPFSFWTPPKPYTTTRRLFFPFQHKFILIGRKSIRRSSSSPLKVAAQSSSDIVLIATEEHHDGSLVFRFGDASEVVENDDVVEEVESQTEQESSVVKVLDGDQGRQVIIETGDTGYESVEQRLVEVSDDIRNAYIGSDIAESVTNDNRDLRDNNEELNESLSDIFEKEVLVLNSDAYSNDSIKVVDRTLDEAKFSFQLDEEESSEPTIYLLDNTPNIEKSADPEGAFLKGSDDKRVSQIEFMDDLDNMEADATSKSDTENVFIELESKKLSQTEVMDDLEVVETEDTRNNDIEEITPSASPATMHISDIELSDAANQDLEEKLKDTIINEGALMDELPPSTSLDVQFMGSVNEDVQEELHDVNINEATIIDDVDKLQEMNISEATLIDEMPSSDQLVVEQPSLDEVSQSQSVDVKDQTMEDELQQVSTRNREENDVDHVAPVSTVEDEEIIVEGEVSQPQSTPFELKPTTQALDIDLNNGILLVDNVIKDPSVSVNLEAIQVSDNEVMDVTQPYAEDESQMVESKDSSEGDTQDLPPPATMNISDVGIDERLLDMNISEGTFIDEMPTCNPLGSEPTLEVSTTKDMDVKDVDTDERLQDMNVIEDAFIDEMPTSNPLVFEPKLEVSTPKGMDVKDVDANEKLQNMNISEGTCIDEMATSDLLGAEPTLEVSTTKDMVVKGVDMDEWLQDMSISEGTFINDIPTSDLLGAESTLEVSTIRGRDVKDVDMDERLHDMNITEGTFIDEMPTSDPLGDEPTLEVRTTEGLGVKDLAVEVELQRVSNGNMGVNSNAYVMPAETIREEVSQPNLTSVELKATMEVSDIKVQNATGQNVDDELLQVIDEHAGDSYIEDAEKSLHQLISQPVQDEGVKHNMLEQCAERLQDMSISEGTFIDEIPTSDPLGAEPTLEVSTTEGVDVKDIAVKDELPLVSNSKMDENESADVMPAEAVLEEEVSQAHLTSVQDATGQNLDEILQVINEDADDSYIEDVEQSPNQLEPDLVQDEGVKYMLEQCDESDAVESSILPKQNAQDPLLEAERTEGMIDSSELAEASAVTALLLAAEAEVKSREEIYLADEFLLSGAALLDHPFKALTGGDDAYFVAGSKWLGVASGVSQWSFEGTGPGVYAQELMRTCEEIVLDTSSIPITNPVELLCRGVKETNMSGSSNVLIANFSGQALHVANIGDTGFLIIRHGVVYKKSSPLLHEFHFAVQVDNSDDPLQLVEEHSIELEVGDIVVSATDGLFDNLYEREITMIVSKSLQAGMKPQQIANMLATRAHEVGKSSFVRSPFSDAAQAAGYTGYAGGKPDNVAVIVSLVEKSSNPLAV